MRRAYFSIILLLISLPNLSAQSKIYVVTTIGGTALTTYSPEGHQESLTIPLGGCSCNGVAVDASGRIFISQNTGTVPIVSYGPNGNSVPNPIPRFAPAAFGVSIGPDGAIYSMAVDGNGKGVVGAFTPAGKPKTSPLVFSGLELAHFTVDNSGKIYVASQADNIVKIYSADGKDTGITVSSGLQTPRAIAVGPNGKIYVANFLNVTSYLPSGQQTNVTLVHQSPGGPDQPNAITVDASGKIYVGFYGRGGVAIYNPDGSLATFFPTLKGVTAIALH